jgi:hypothetical protein
MRDALTPLCVQAALAAMMQLELPHVNVLTKMDLLKDKRSDVEQCVLRLSMRMSRRRPHAADVSPLGAAGSSTRTQHSLLTSCSTPCPVAIVG